jgi:hypothetical protein
MGEDNDEQDQDEIGNDIPGLKEVEHGHKA